MKKMKLFSLLLTLTMVLSLAAGLRKCRKRRIEGIRRPAGDRRFRSGTGRDHGTRRSIRGRNLCGRRNRSPPEIGPYEANEEHTDISVLFQYPAFFQGFFPEGWISSEWWTVMGEKTNTTFDLREISNLEWSENVNLLCASGDLPDLVTNRAAFTAAADRSHPDEMIIDIAPLVEENAPRYYRAVTQDDYTLKTCITDDGQMGAMFPILEEPFPVTNGLWIRQDGWMSWARRSPPPPRS